MFNRNQTVITEGTLTAWIDAKCKFCVPSLMLSIVDVVHSLFRCCVVVGELAGIAVGATVMLNILVAGPSSGGSMNPVRTLGPALASGNYRSLWVYLVAPTLGAISGAAVYTGVKLNDSATDPPRQVRSFRPLEACVKNKRRCDYKSTLNVCIASAYKSDANSSCHLQIKVCET
ncbi:hypothetical protein YC2023_018333 [Brassica napus]